MRLGIIGLPQVGKKTFFEVLANQKLSIEARTSHKPIKGSVEVQDNRFDRLVDIYKPKKEVRARIEIDILPKLEKETIQKGEIFSEINMMDGLCHVVRAFKDESVYHVSGSVDPKRDIDIVSSELILHDLIFIEKRLERLEKEIKSPKVEASIKEKELLLKLRTHLENQMPLRVLELSSDEKKMMTSCPFTTRKGMIVVLNVSEDDLKDNALVNRFKGNYEKLKIEVMRVSAKVESEIEGLESKEEQREFLKSLGIEEPAMNILSRASMRALDLVSFFTVKSDEVRQWTIRAGSTAHEAAGAIHSDLARGFIRAEVIKYSDLDAFGGEEKVRQTGKLYLKGKEYIVEDGDIITIRFNV